MGGAAQHNGVEWVSSALLQESVAHEKQSQGNPRMKKRYVVGGRK